MAGATPQAGSGRARSLALAPRRTPRCGACRPMRPVPRATTCARWQATTSPPTVWPSAPTTGRCTGPTRRSIALTGLTLTWPRVRSRTAALGCSLTARWKASPTAAGPMARRWMWKATTGWRCTKALVCCNSRHRVRCCSALQRQCSARPWCVLGGRICGRCSSRRHGRGGRWRSRRRRCRQGRCSACGWRLLDYQ